MRRAGRAARALGLLAVLAGTATGGARLERLERAQPAGETLLYLPDGKRLAALSFGHRALLADLVYLWAIQYYSSYARADRYRYVEHVFGNVITELDPQYVDAYWLGALILTLEARDLDAGLRLLDKGTDHNPGSWVLPYIAGWECRFAGQFTRAAEYFRRAAAVPGAPPNVRRAVAGMYGLAGDVHQALAEWQAVRDDPASDPASVAIAERQVRDLRVRADLGDLESARDRFRSRNGRLPARLDELVARGYLARLPRDPDGSPYAYDARTGAISSAAGRVLRER